MNGSKHYLFDWGDTLMVDLPHQTGPMCDWPKVEVVEGALACLQKLSQSATCHLATNAADSSEIQIRQALQRAGLSDYIQHIFCRENLGVGKNNPTYFTQIISILDAKPSDINMIGDSLEKDMYPALEAGVNVIWLNTKEADNPKHVPLINHLKQL